MYRAFRGFLAGWPALLFGACGAERTIVPPAESTVDCIVPGPRVSPSSVTVYVGSTFPLRVFEQPPPCGAGSQTDGKYRWASSNSTIASVDSVTGVVTARATGLITITAAKAADRNVKGAAVVQVIPY